MLQTARGLCEAIDGAKIAYMQSDEISILVTDWSSLDTQPWFDYRIQKVASVTSSLATALFNEAKNQTMFEVRGSMVEGAKVPSALFDCRAFNVPAHEVVNYFLWRQQDATRNSIQGLAQANFSHRQLHGKNNNVMQEMLFSEKGINWNDCPTGQKRGFCVVNRETMEKAVVRGELVPVVRSRWEVDEEIPVFSQDRDYIQSLVDQGVR